MGLKHYVLVLVPLVLVLLMTMPASAEQLAKVEIFEGNTLNESLTVLKDCWIELGGGKEVKVPSIEFYYSGVDNARYQRGTKTVNITSFVGSSYSVVYPYSSHRIYNAGDNVVINLNTTLGSAEVHLYTVRTYPTEVKNAIEQAIDGDTSTLRNLLSNAYDYTTFQLSNGRGSTTLSNVPAGDYVVVALLNASSDRNVTLVAATAFTVLEHGSTLSVPSTVQRSSSYLDGTFSIVGGSESASYRYVVALIKEDRVAKFTLTSDGTKATTDLKLNDATLVQGFRVGGVGLNNVNADTVTDWLNDAFGGYISVATTSTGTSFDFSLVVQDLPAGSYYLYAAAWNSTNSSQRVVAFNWTEVNIVTVTPTTTTPTPTTTTTATPRPPAGGGGGGGGGGGAPLPGAVPGVVGPYITIKAGEEGVFKLSYSTFLDVYVKSITFKPEEDTDIKVTIKRYMEAPEGVPALPNTAFYLEVDLQMSWETKVSGEIEFAVPRSLIAEKGFDPDNVIVKMLRYDNGWKELETKFVGSDEEYNYYVASTPGFSFFAVKLESPAVTTTVSTTTTATATTAAVTTTPAKPWWAIPGFEAVFAIAGLLGVAYLLRRRG